MEGRTHETASEGGNCRKSKGGKLDNREKKIYFQKVEVAEGESRESVLLLLTLVTLALGKWGYMKIEVR